MDAACATETRAFCAHEADLLALLESVHGQEDDKVQARRARVHECLVDHADELSPPCVAALVGNVATQHSALPKPEGQDGVETTTADKENPSEDTTKQAPALLPVKVTIAPAQDQPLPPAAAQLQPQYVQTTGDIETGVEVRIFLINHPGQGVAVAAPLSTPTYVRVGGDASGDQHKAVAKASAAGMGLSPWLWILMLPFMCIGMYVSIAQTLAFVRRRRDVVYRVGAAQYMPIPTSLNPTKPLRSSPSTTTES